MMPPTSIDGTDITGATIDGTEVTEITVDGQTVFSAGPDIPDGEVARWEFENDVTDSWNGYDGTNNGATFTTDSQVGNFAIDTDGTDDYIDFGNIEEISGVSEASISIWVKMNEIKGAAKIMGYYESFNNGHFIRTSDTDKFHVRVENSGTVVQEKNVSSYTTGVWYHLVLTFNSGSIVFYKDSSQIASASGGPSTTPTLNNWVIGGNDGNEILTDPFDAVFDDARIYDKELTASEVSNLYNNGSI